MSKTNATIVMLGLASLFIMPNPLSAATPDAFTAANEAYVQEFQTVDRTQSHLGGLVSTIDRLFDSAAHGRIDVALIGLQEVPAWVHDLWTRREPDAQEVSISRYVMTVEAPDVSRMEFFRFRSIRTDGTVVENFLQNIHQHKKAAVIFTLRDGDPFGPHQNLQTSLLELLSTIEEGMLTMRPLTMNEAPQRVANVWRSNVDPKLAGAATTVEAFDGNNPGGQETWYRVSAASDGFEQEVIVYQGKLVFSNRNGAIVAR